MVNPKKYGKKWTEQRRRILDRDGWLCCWCGADLTHYGAKPTVDHIIPLARGGTRDDDNCMAACAPCNYSRNNDGSAPKRLKRDKLIPDRRILPTGGGMGVHLSREDKTRAQRWKMNPGGQG